MTRRRVSIQWRRPPDRAAAAPLVGESVQESLPSPVSARPFINRILQELGTPEVTGAANAKEEAIGLLQFAAEIEHSLMVQYIYAASSVPPAATGGIDGRSKIMSVATQEMGHLVSVQNLLLLVGGPEALHFGRDDIRAANPENPIPLVLEPVSADALAKFIAAEMPAEIPDVDLKKRVDEIVANAKSAAHVTLHQVGALYAKLFWLFQPDDTPIPPLDLSPNESLGLKPGRHLGPADFTDAAVIAEFEALRDDWMKGSVSGFILTSVPTAAAARDLITAISEQGEGLGSAHDSHFFEFFELHEALKAGQLQATALPVNPVARLAPAPDAGTSAPVTTPYAKLWAELFDIRYNLLLLDLWHAFSTPKSSSTRKALITLAYTNMHFVRELIEQLLAIREMVGCTDAAPPFGLLHEDLPDQDALRWQRHEQLLVWQTDTLDAIRNSPEFQDCSSTPCEVLDFEGQIRIGNIEQSDAIRRTLIQSGSGGT